MIFDYLAWTILLVFCTAAVLSYKKRKARYKWLRKFPGTPQTSLIGGIWRILSNNAKNLKCDPGVNITEQELAQALLHEETGMHCFWYGPVPLIRIYKAEIVELVLRAGSSEKSDAYKFLHKWMGTGLLTSTGSKWKQRRKLLTPCFHLRILEDFFPVYNEQSLQLIEKLKSLSHEEYIDIRTVLFPCTFDIIWETLMGVSIGTQSGDHQEYIQAVHDLGDIIMQLRPLLRYDDSFGLTEIGKQYNKLTEIVHNFTDKFIKDKKEKFLPGVNLSQTEKGRYVSFLDFLLDMKVNQQLLSDSDIQGEVDTFMTAGFEATATSTIFTLYCIGLYPEVQAKISEELNEIFKGDIDRPVTYEDTKRMRYLECVIKESLRLYPPVPSFSRKLYEDLTFGDLNIPKDTTVMVNVLALHRNSKVFPNPEIFDPKRFLPENSVGRHRFAYIPFSAGPRNCMGQNLAMLEEKAIVSNILRHFNVVSLDPRDKFHINTGLILKPTQEVRLKFLPKF